MLPLTGKYKLISHGTYNSNDHFSPTSPFVNGELCYNSDLSLSVIIVFYTNKKHIEAILAYSGEYRMVSATELIHKISFCSKENKNNTEEIRTYLFDGKNLILGQKLENDSRFEAVWELK